MKIAAIDIGSNAARLQISNVLHNEGRVSFKKVEYVRFPLRLGVEVFNTGEISPEGEVRLFKMLHAFKLLMELHEVEDYLICATSAMREASNTPAIITRIYKILDMKIHLIDGSKEAELVNNVVVGALNPQQNHLHIDVGGGSTELNLYIGQEKAVSKSFKLGSVRLLEHKDSEADWRKMKKWVTDLIVPNRDSIVAVGTGGNINKLFDLAQKQESEPPCMTFEELERLHDHIASFSLSDRINKLRLNPDRADVIVPAAELYLSVMEWAGAKKIVVPDVGLKDGIIQMLYDRLIARKKKVME